MTLRTRNAGRELPGWSRLLPSARASLKAALATAWFSLTAAGLPHWSDMDGTGTDRLHSLFCPLQMISQISWRSKPVPILLWLLGVPFSVVIVLWLVNVI